MERGAEEHAFGDEELVHVSALEHYSYCPRQCALIYREQTFDENLYTLRGEAAHERVHEEATTTEEGLRVERALPLWSARLGLVGKADVVEFHPSEHGEVPYPVEYKYGPHSGGRHAEVQLCAQALCLEEMTGRPVLKGAVYQVSSRRRREVLITPALRQKTCALVEAVRHLLKEGALPPPVADARCPNCSLLDSCMPAAIAASGRARALYARLFVVEAEA